MLDHVFCLALARIVNVRVLRPVKLHGKHFQADSPIPSLDHVFVLLAALNLASRPSLDHVPTLYIYLVKRCTRSA